LVHGEAETEQAKAAASALFGGGELRDLSSTTLAAVMSEAGASQASASSSVTDLLIASGLVTSRSEARRVIAEGGAYLNNARVTDPDLVPGNDDLVHGWAVLRRGKRRIAGVKISAE